MTFRLHGSLPANRVFPPERLTSGKAFVAMDRILDRAEHGPSFLRRPDVAGLVAAAVRDGERRFRRYQLHAFVVMPNHVHLLVTPHVIATRWLGPLKGYTGHLANQLLGHCGQTFLAGLKLRPSSQRRRRVGAYSRINSRFSHHS